MNLSNIGGYLLSINRLGALHLRKRIAPAVHCNGRRSRVPRLPVRCKRTALLEENADDGWVRAQPGVVLAEMNKQLASTGWFYGIDPSTQNRATIGGGVGNNSCGAHSIVYGKTIDNVLGLRAILSDATPVVTEPLGGGRA